jgi:hypothetical protein
MGFVVFFFFSFFALVFRNKFGQCTERVGERERLKLNLRGKVRKNSNFYLSMAALALFSMFWKQKHASMQLKKTKWGKES